MSAFRRIQPIITKVSKIMQGNIDYEAWKLARKNKLEQYMVMINKITKIDLLKEYGQTPIPMWLDPDQLPFIDRLKIGWYDEMYIKQEGGKHILKEMQIRFPPDKNGRLDPTSVYHSPIEYKAI